MAVLVVLVVLVAVAVLLVLVAVIEKKLVRIRKRAPKGYCEKLR